MAGFKIRDDEALARVLQQQFDHESSQISKREEEDSVLALKLSGRAHSLSPSPSPPPTRYSTPSKSSNSDRIQKRQRLDESTKVSPNLKDKLKVERSSATSCHSSDDKHKHPPPNSLNNKSPKKHFESSPRSLYASKTESNSSASSFSGNKHLTQNLETKCLAGKIPNINAKSPIKSQDSVKILQSNSSQLIPVNKLGPLEKRNQKFSPTQSVSEIKKKNSLILGERPRPKPRDCIDEATINFKDRPGGNKLVDNERSSPSSSTINRKRAKCKYGEQCYRMNPSHRKEFSHSSDAGDEEEVEAPVRKKARLTPNDIWMSQSPYYFFMTKVSGIDNQHNYTAFHISEILSSAMGSLIASAQFNYMFDIPWLVEQYPREFRSCPLLLIHGEVRAAKAEVEKQAAPFPHIKLCQAKLEIMFGTHHTKMMFLLYKEGLRIVIHTSNIVPSDWHQRSQGMWVSPVFPPLNCRTSSTDGDSDTHFKSDLLEYLEAYKAIELAPWIKHIEQHDLSTARVFLIGSVPGRHTGSRKTSFGHLKLRKVLQTDGPDTNSVDRKWSVVGQFSSIGSLGNTPSQWLEAEWLTSLSAGVGPRAFKPSLKLIYPCVENVRKSLEGYPAGASLPYSIDVARKQPWLSQFLHQWQSGVRGRSEASPHIKTYMRTSPDSNQLAWILITSANLSKAAWGALEKQESQLMVRSYELGVLFIPKFYKNQSTFTVGTTASADSFPVPYDLPPVPYGASDRPWIWNIPYTQLPDRHYNKWCPPLK